MSSVELALPTSSEQPQQQQQQQQQQAAETQTAPEPQQLQATGNPPPPSPLPPRPPPPIIRVSAGQALLPPSSPLWPLLTPARVTGDEASATTAAASTAPVADLLSSWNLPAAPVRSSPQASGAATAIVQDRAAATSEEEEEEASRASEGSPRPPTPHPTPAAGFAAAAATREGREPAPRRSHGRLDTASASLAAAAMSPTDGGGGGGGRGAPAEDTLTAEEAQAIIDAADMAAAEAVVAAAEAAEASAIAARADLQSPAGPPRSPATPGPAVTPRPPPPDDDFAVPAVPLSLGEIVAAEAEAAGLMPLSSPGAAGGARAAGLADEEREVAAAVAAVAEEEARNRLQSSAGWAGAGGVTGPVVRGTPGGADVVVIGISRCTLCRSVVERVVPPDGVPQNENSNNCRNCWRVVCDNCIGTFWPRTMVPPRYTVDSNEYRMRVCKTCDTVMEAFRKALLLGQVEEAMSAYSTGCVNLDLPYTIYHGELPVHCAAAGGNVGLLSWLVDDLGCRLFVDSIKKEPVRDLRRLTVLGAAAINEQVQVMRYLVKKKGCSVSEITHIPTLKSAIGACLDGSAITRDGERSRYKVDSSPGSSANAAGYSVSPGASASLAVSVAAAEEEDDSCIVCFDAPVDCTLVPCGHHCCCGTCAAKFNVCPVCRRPITQKIKTISL